MLPCLAIFYIISCNDICHFKMTSIVTFDLKKLRSGESKEFRKKTALNEIVIRFLFSWVWELLVSLTQWGHGSRRKLEALLVLL